MSLTDAQCSALAECLASADDLLQQVALPILLASGNPNRVLATLVAAATMGAFAFDEGQSEPIEDRINQLVKMTLTIINEMNADGDSPAKAFNFNRLAKAHQVISAITGKAGPRAQA